jgi:hypothetical protein
MRGPSFWNAKFEGANKVPPSCGCAVLLILSNRPVLPRPSSSVLNSPGRREMMEATLGGGMRRESMPWTTPLVPKMLTAMRRL